MEESVTISDDEEDAPPIIILDEEKSDCNENIIDIESDEIARTQTVKILVTNIRRENELFATLLEKCLNLENSEGMLRIIQKYLLKLYTNAEETYKTSNSFKKAVRKALICLRIDRAHLFGHLKSLCHTLRLHAKKTVQVTTLASKLKDKNQSKRKSIVNRVFKKQKIEKNSLDSDDEPNVISSDSSQPDDVIILDDFKNILEDDVRINENDETRNNSDDEKENHTTNENFDKSHSLPKTEEMTKGETMNEEECESYLIPKTQEVYHLEPSSGLKEINLEAQIKEIEEQILQQELLVQKYDKQEVDKDNSYSPYILSAKAQVKIAELYKTLCELTGHNPVKRRMIRLQLLEGHPEGPTKKLEQMINSKIGEDGYPPFPDYCDVVKCVLEASAEDGLGWNKPQVMREATSLFTQCGRALQKRRQEREYRDLMSRLKSERLGTDDYDPADEDQELARKLEENRRVAARMEDEVFERYTKMQYLTTQPKAGPSFEHASKNEVVASASTSDDSEDIDESETDHHESRIVFTVLGGPDADEPNGAMCNYRNQNGGDFVDGPCKVSGIDQNGRDFVKGGVSTNMIGESSGTSQDENTDNLSDTESYDSGNDSNSSVIENNVIANTPDPEDPNTNANESGITTDKSIEKGKIKQEPVDVCKLLDELGDDFTTTILIDDPFLVIEISSDSEMSD